MKLKINKNIVKSSIFLTPLLLVGAGYFFTYSNFRVGADTQPDVYCFPRDAQACGGNKDVFLVYNLKNIITDDAELTNLKKKMGDLVSAHDYFTLQNNGRDIRIPIDINPDQFNKIYNDKGEVIDPNIIQAWDSVSKLYSAIASSSAENFNDTFDSDGYHANTVNQEITRRLSQGMASYTKTNHCTNTSYASCYVVYNFSKHVPNKTERNLLDGGIPPSSSQPLPATYQPGSDILELAPTLTLGQANPAQNKINRLNATQWRDIGMIYSAIASSASQRPDEEWEGGQGAKWESVQTQNNVNDIQKLLDTYRPISGNYEIIERNGKNYYLVYNIFNNGFNQTDNNDVNTEEDGEFDQFHDSLTIEGYDNAIIPINFSSAVGPSFEISVTQNARYARLLYKLYEIIRTDGGEASASISRLETLLKSYHTPQGCFGWEGKNTQAFLDSPSGSGDNTFVVCDAATKSGLSNEQIAKIKRFGHEIEINPIGQLRVPENLTLSPITDYTDPVVLGAWQGVKSVYETVRANSTSVSKTRNAINAITAIETALLGPVPYALSGYDPSDPNGREIILKTSLAIQACADEKAARTHNPDVQMVDSDQKCQITKPANSNTNKPFNRAEIGSSAENIMNEALAAAQTRNNSSVAAGIEAMHAIYLRWAPVTVGDSRLSITAPDQFLYDNTNNGEPRDSGRPFIGYETAHPPVTYKYNFNDLIGNSINLTTDKIGLALFILNGEDSSKPREYVMSLQELQESVKADSLSWFPRENQAQIGTHTFQLILFKYNTLPSDWGSPTAANLIDDSAIIASTKLDYEVRNSVATSTIAPTEGSTSFSFTVRTPINLGDISEIISSPLPTSPPKLIPSEGADESRLRTYYAIYIARCAGEIWNIPLTQLNRTWPEQWWLKEMKAYNPGQKINYQWNTKSAAQGGGGTQDGRHFVAVVAVRATPEDASTVLVSQKSPFDISLVPPEAVKQAKIIVNPSTVPVSQYLVKATGQRINQAASKPQISVSGGSPVIKFLNAANIFDDKKTVIGKIVAAFLDLLSGLAVISITVGGIQYITSGGDTAKSGKAKKTVIYSVIGVIIVTASVTIITVVINELNRFLK